MRPIFNDSICKIVLLVVWLCTSLLAFSQRTAKPNSAYRSVHNQYSLEAVIPVDSIQSITVANDKGTYILINVELAFLKAQLIEAKYAGGLLLKPGHIRLVISVMGHSTTDTVQEYSYTGNINFDGVLDKNGHRFSGTFYLPLAINFDQYRPANGK